MALYFAYGSNLNAAQMRARCPGATRVGRAALPLHRLAFAGYSARWGGAVATIREDDEAFVPGLVYAVSKADMATLDAFEGCPTSYARGSVVVYGERNAKYKAVTYAHVSGDPRALPSSKYVAQIAASYRALRYSAFSIVRAEQEARRMVQEKRADATRVFVYGSLMAGERIHSTLADAEFDGVVRTARGFRMHDLGPYPAIVREGDGRVTGEVYLASPETVAALDRIEGHPNYYRREQIQLANGATAYAYIMKTERVAEKPVVADGDWKRQLRRREDAPQAELWGEREEDDEWADVEDVDEDDDEEQEEKEEAS